MYTALQQLKAAAYYLDYQGLEVNSRACNNLVSQLGAEAVVRMAIERGFKL